jgi:hypothetical protein
MQAGMAASLVGIGVNLMLVGSLKSAIRQSNSHLTAAQVDSAQRLFFGLSIASGLVGAAMWLWMAQSCRAGKPWARTLSTVLFGIYTVAQIYGAATPSSAVARVYDILVWLIGLVAVVFLWQRSSTEYFHESRRIL